MTSAETRTQPFSMSPVSPISPVDIEPRQYRRGSMVDDAMAEPFMRVGRRGSDGSDGSLSPIEKRDRRMSKEWDASKTPPSRFQKMEGSARVMKWVINGTLLRIEKRREEYLKYY
ncbi:uncharacterized protein LAJ45_04476 [Morchella importuna]|uniref:uncharacterized protein n=1 Tax=Morchella importuna TaxID=1174673 RepID=UPI001E8CE473|nr:uncharacterized protein LAJ45_04476 [Morchella importuna]KAH8151274.1 hypothetical protein LAJ45_04476 [Morchella importuna]